MSSSIKNHIIKKVYENIFSTSKLATIEQIAPQITILKNPTQHVEFQLDSPVSLELENEKEYQSVQIHSAQVSPDNIILSTSLSEYGNLKIAVDEKELIKDVLDSNPIQFNFKPQKKKVVVEFSSPNVAKPFHAGHLRSTIIGNFISNIKSKLGRDVIRMNYLGDWGTQFGMLKLGVDNMGVSEEELKAKPAQVLFEAYVWANREAEKDPKIHDRAREEFRKLEEGDQASLCSWNKFRDLSTADLERTYSRLGVNFDEYHWESKYGKKEIGNVVNRLYEQGLLRTDEKGRQCAYVRGRPVPMVRSDGAGLYLSRDVAAALERQRITSFHEMLYVVENGQADHFQSLFSICRELGINNSWNMQHVKFGRIHGMSTRQGKVVFLHDILDQARDLVFEGLKSTKTNKVEPSLELADALGSASVIINDLKQRRVKDYEFSWEKTLQISGDTAVRLQYTHCRLCSLLENSAYTPAETCDPNALAEPEAKALILEIARYEECLLRAHSDLEACILVNYIFHLTHAANKAFKVLPVKNSGGHVGSQRLLLFNSCKKVLGDALKLLGITPLERM